ncbi:MAG: Amidohydrolase [Lentisphaerae bacterium ADurb.BinA184]|nr:MAG: Amidohydrolase [Lentisphaerae bacterium ADurb.BinA184]
MSALLDMGRAGRRLDGVDIVDMHGHLGPYAYGQPQATAAALIADMDRVGVAAIACSHMQCLGDDMARGNDEILAAMQAWPGRILGYACAWPSDRDSVRREIELRLGQGFTGIKIHRTPGFSYLDPSYEPAFALAHEQRRPVLLHTWAEDRDFSELRELAGRYPEAPILMAHSGVHSEGRHIELARQCPNIYLDTAMSRMPRGAMERLVAGAGAERVLWGSDALFLSLTYEVGRALGARLPDDVKRQIMGGNARRILGSIRS